VKILIAPDKFKGCLDAAAVCRAISTGWLRAKPHDELDLCPLADGGEGTAAALVAATAGRTITRRVTGPLPEMKVDAAFGILGDGATAVVEMAAASGLVLLPEKDRNPMATTTFGAGQLMAAAAQAGARRIIVAIGGSATIDAGIGAAQACGLPVLLAAGEIASDTEPLTGADLEKVLMIKHGRGGKVDRLTIEAACDVNNPLCGPNGAAAVFGPQKGATPQQVAWFDDQLARLAHRTGHQATAQLPGAGAAGGFGFGLAAFFAARLRPGIEIVLEAVGFAARLAKADLCITGEGCLDVQSLAGKTPIGVSRLCKQAGVPCVAIAGSVEIRDDQARAAGITQCVALRANGMTSKESIGHAAELIEKTAMDLARIGPHM
jgi:glycerate kinase